MKTRQKCNNKDRILNELLSAAYKIHYIGQIFAPKCTKVRGYYVNYTLRAFPKVADSTKQTVLYPVICW